MPLLQNRKHKQRSAFRVTNLEVDHPLYTIRIKHEEKVFHQKPGHPRDFTKNHIPILLGLPEGRSIAKGPPALFPRRFVSLSSSKWRLVFTQLTGAGCGEVVSPGGPSSEVESSGARNRRSEVQVVVVLLPELLENVRHHSELSEVRTISHRTCGVPRNRRLGGNKVDGRMLKHI